MRILTQTLLVVFTLTSKILAQSCPIKLLVSSYTEYSCELGQINQTFKGINVLFDQTTNISSLTMTGWYRLLGNSDLNYLLIQANNGSSQTIITLSYNPVQKKIYSQMLSQPLVTQDISAQLHPYLQQNWFFVRIGMALNENNSGSSYIYYIIQTILSNTIPSQAIYYEQLIYAPTLIYFDNSQFSISYGFSSYFPYSASCAVTKQVMLFIGKANTSSQGALYSISKQEMNIEAIEMVYVNFSIVSSLKLVSLNIAPMNVQLISITDFFNTTPSFQNQQVLLGGNYIWINLINFEERNGIVFQIDFRIEGDLTNAEYSIIKMMNYDILESLNLIKYEILIPFDGTNLFIQDHFLNDFSNSVMIQKNTWYRLTCSLQIVFNQIIKNVYLNDQLFFHNKYPYSFLGRVYFYLINRNIYSSSQNNRIVILKTFKAYSGGFYESCGNCSMAMNIQNTDCLMCKSSSDFLKQSKQYSCVPACDNVQYDNQAYKSCNWNDPTICQQGFYAFYTNACVCPDGQYAVNSSSCGICPEYCITCSSSTQCIDFYQPRGNDGKCNNLGDFDDGRTCISDYMTIPNTQNTPFQLINHFIDCNNLSQYNNIEDYTFTDETLHVGTMSDSFFFSLNFNLALPFPLVAGNIYTICYFTEYESHLFTLAVQVTTNNNLQLTVSEDSGLTLQVAHIEANKNIWIGFYSDLFQFYLIVSYENSPVSYYSGKFKKMDELVLYNPKLVIGMKSPIFQNSFPLCGTIGTNNWIIKGHESMERFQYVLLNQKNEDLLNILNFNFCEYDYVTIKSNLTIQNKYNHNQIMSFEIANSQFDKQRGLYLDSTNQVFIGLDSLLTSTPFVVQISLTPINKYDWSHHYFFNICYNGEYIIQFKSVHNNFYGMPFFEICMLENCIQLKYARFFYDLPNFLCKHFLNLIKQQFSDIQHNNSIDKKIVVKIQSQKDIGVEIVKFNVILNYKSEDLQFVFPFSNYNQPHSFNVVLGQVINQNAYLCQYISDIQIYLGGFYHVDYNNKNSCFIWMNRSNMECIMPKKGFDLKNNKVIPSSDCNKGESFDNPLLYFNPFTLKCQNSNIYIPFCAEVSNANLNNCIRCIDTQMNPANNCQCPLGMYPDKQEQKCIECSLQCQSCSENKNNCLICKGREQNSPECNCLLSNQYLDNNGSCSYCHSQCSSCSENPDQCVTCSQGRINPPSCDCDPYHQFDPLINDCVLIHCNNKCNSCLYQAENCITCKGDRQNPPSCDCLEGTYENLLIQLEYCSKCQSNYYYDDSSKSCQRCDQSCQECNGPTDYNCLSCYGNLMLIDNSKCVCMQGNHQAFDGSNQSFCYNYMNIITSIEQVGNSYYILIEFEYTIDSLEQQLKQYGIKTLFNLQISQIPQEFYSITDYKIQSDNQLILILSFTQSFQTTVGFFLFKQTNTFINWQKQVVLDPIYQKNPFRFTIGPLMLQSKSYLNILHASQLLSSINKDLMSFLKYFQILFYLLNSVQPTAMFLLVKIQLPINFYNVLSLFGIFTYRDMPFYGENTLKKGYTLYGMNIDSYINVSGNIQFDRFGFRDSFFINCQMIFYKYTVFFLIIAIIILLNLAEQKWKQNKLLIFMLKKVIKENEIVLLMILLSLLIQMDQLDQSNFINRIGFYTGLFVFCCFVSSTLLSFIKYNSLPFQKRTVFEDFFEKLNKNKVNDSRIVRNYYFIYFSKKCILLILIYSLVNYPITLCYFGAVLNFLTGLLTLYLRPHYNIVLTLIKGTGDCVLGVIWIYMIKFNKFFEKNNNQIVINNEQVEQMLKQGLIASLLVIIFNSIYFISFLLEVVIFPIYYALKKRTSIFLALKKYQFIEERRLTNENNQLPEEKPRAYIEVEQRIMLFQSYQIKLPDNQNQTDHLN